MAWPCFYSRLAVTRAILLRVSSEFLDTLPFFRRGSHLPEPCRKVLRVGRFGPHRDPAF
jgi:hypothetical protein